MFHQVDVSVREGRVIRRRDFLRAVPAAALAAGAIPWSDWMSLQADELRQKQRACILLWMEGGPSQFETFSPKPEHANGGETKTIQTSVPGIQIADKFPRVAEVAQELAIIRSMTSSEGSHPRATYLLHTGYLPLGSVKYPAFGATAVQQLGKTKADLPAFVRIGGGRQYTGDGGLLGVDYDPFVLQAAGRPPANTAPATDLDRYNARLSLLDKLEGGSAAATDLKNEIADHRKLYRKAARMIQSSQMQAFDLDQEPASVREQYGASTFASGCLLARRLIEAGVTFVEVSANGWDTHNDNFAATTRLAGQIDQPFAHLIKDLKQRGLLDTTLVVWMGEFGRTPRINPRAGRDHYPKAFNVVLAGGGVRGGQVIGASDAAGVEVAERPVTVPDLFQSFCRSLRINPKLENFATNGRPIKAVDGGAPVEELFS